MPLCAGGFMRVERGIDRSMAPGRANGRSSVNGI
jgi:hypothetical protein